MDSDLGVEAMARAIGAETFTAIVLARLLRDRPDAIDIVREAAEICHDAYGPTSTGPSIPAASASAAAMSKLIRAHLAPRSS